MRSIPRAVLVLLVVLTPLAAGCAVSEKEELELGRKSFAQFEQQFGGLYGDARLQGYVNGVGMTMAPYAGRPNLDWRYQVVNSSQVNAFAVPGGYIYITQGLLFRLSNEAELAAVLGHETGHIAKRHSVKQIEKARGAQVVSTTVGLVGSVFGYGIAGDVTSLVSNLALMKYGRDQEREADLSGLEYMSRAGYNPRGMVQTMQVLQSASGGGGKGGPDFLSTHPNPGNRIGYLKDTIQKRYAQAAQTGTFGEDNFRRNVLSRGDKLGRIDRAHPEAWCLTCRQRANEVARARPAGKLSRDAR
jgi:predicted Zn-dependent protease